MQKLIQYSASCFCNEFFNGQVINPDRVDRFHLHVIRLTIRFDAN